MRPTQLPSNAFVMHRRRLICLLAPLAFTLPASAQSLPPQPTPDPSIEHQRQQERAEQLRRQLEQAEDVRRPDGPAADTSRLPSDEQPCFAIQQVSLGGDAGLFPGLATALAGAAHDDAPEGRCLGSQGIKLLLKRLQHVLIARGYITSRVSVPNQDLNDGSLEISVHAGRVEALRLAQDSQGQTSLAAAMPVRQGELLNLRDIEQGLENLKRLPSADADIEIHPSAVEGASDLVVRYRRDRPWRVALAADDGGLKATGKYQGSVTLAYDNPTGLNDMAYLTVSHDMMVDGAQRGTWGALGHYAIPWGYWSADLTVSRNRDRQTVQGATTDYIYGGYSNTAELNLTRIVHRDGRGKTALRVGAWRRSAHNFIDDTEVEVQHRQTGGWQLGASHRRFLGTATVDATLEYKRGTGAFGAIPAPEEPFGEATSRFRKTTLDIAYDRTVVIAGTALAFAAQMRAQWNHSRLNPQELFVIGGRYTVRGFDGESVLAAERGWLLRNELAVPLAAHPAAAYLAIDTGRIGGPTADRLAGRHLTGGAIGLRGAWREFQYDLFAGAPLRKPKAFDTSDRTVGFRLNLTL